MQVVESGLRLSYLVSKRFPWRVFISSMDLPAGATVGSDVAVRVMFNCYGLRAVPPAGIEDAQETD